MHAVDVCASGTVAGLSWRFFMGQLAQVECCRRPALLLAFRTPSGATGKYAGSTCFAAGYAIDLANARCSKYSGRRD